MAKVYEAKQDAIRDVITSNIKEEDNSKEAFGGFAIVSTLLSSLYFEVDRLRVKVAEQSRNAKDHVWESNHAKGWIVASLGALSAVFYFVARHNVGKLKKERAQLGQEAVVFLSHAHDEPNISNQHVSRLERSKGDSVQQSFER